MHDKQDLKSPARRVFIRGAGVGAAGVAAVGLTPAPADAAAGTDPKGRKVSGYRETEHVRKVYETARF